MHRINLARINPQYINITYEEIQLANNIGDILTSNNITYKSGTILKSNFELFMEWSGITFLENDYVLFVANTGAYLISKMEFDNINNFKSLAAPFISPIYMGNSPLKSQYRDVEEVSYIKNIGCILSHEPIAGFENFISLSTSCNFSVNNVFSILESPPYFKYMHSNKGIEALAASTEGNIVAIEEFGQDKLLHKMFIWNINKTKEFRTLFYPTEYYVGVSGCTFMPDGSVLVLERKIKHCLTNYSYTESFETRVNLVPSTELKYFDNHIVKKQPIITIRNNEQNSNKFAQNYEGIGIKVLSDHVNIFMLSDNGPLHETVLLQFELF